MILMCKITVLLIVLTLASSVHGYRILGLFPHPGLSHFKVFHPIMRGLANDGHHVTVVSYFPDANPVPNYQDLRFEGQKILTNAFSLEVWRTDFTGRTFFDNFNEFHELVVWGMDSCKAALNSSAIDEIFKAHQTVPFDLVVIEFFATDCMAAIAWMLEVPLVGLSSCALMPWHYDRVGLPDSPSYIPSEFSTFSENMGPWERMENWIVTRAVKNLYRIVQMSDNTLLKAKFPNADIPDVTEIVRNTSLILVNQHYTLSGARPLIPSVVEIGGVHIQNAKPLPSELKQIMDQSSNGVILVSFGSVLKAATLPNVKRNAMMEAFQQLDQQVVWKWEEELENQPKNLYTQRWLPQRDALCHNNVRLFLSHGGLLGVSEAVHCGVPVVVMPIYGDQFLNAAALVNRGAGVRMDYEHTDNVTYIADCIREGLSERKKQMAQSLSRAYNTRPQPPLDLALWSIVNVIENGAMQYERSYAAELPWYIYYSLDVILVLLFAAIAIVFGVSYGCW
uniref:UDP-glucuronosyltransferase n=1 Tax=Anopheles christyi TaxID=43041 RepID=A0A182JNW2_9DIPT